MRNTFVVSAVLSVTSIFASVNAQAFKQDDLFQKKLQQGSQYSAVREIESLKNTKSICGMTNDLQHVNNYNGTLGQSMSFVKAYKARVGAMSAYNTQNAKGKYCSGTLIGENLFLTASHCIGEDVLSHFVVFNYEVQKGTSDALLTQDFYRITKIVEDGVDGLDYAILRLSGAPGAKYGYAKVNPNTVSTNHLLTIIQHPKGHPKKVDAGHHLGSSGNYMYYNDLDTEPGSSGSGILDISGNVVGVHTLGGCTASSNSTGNSGVRMSKIVQASGVL